MLRITKNDALIGINITPLKMNISQPKADFEMRQKPARVIIKSEPLQIKIDQSQAFNEAGLKDNAAFSEDMVARSKQAAAEGLSRIVSEGNSMAAIESGGNAIAEIAAANSIQIFDWNIDFIPKSKPVIDFIGGNIDISVDEGYVDIKTKPNKPIIDVEVGSVDIFLRQKPDIKVEYLGKEVDEIV